MLRFDFGQNLPLPKIPAIAQFYLSLIWFNVFNVHILNNSESYMFTFMEGFLGKGGDTICNFLLYAIREELKKNMYNKMYLFSDACGGQNRNYTVFIFLSLLSEFLDLEIQHLYHVRGHSYCQCYRNFGLYGKMKKITEVIESDSEYYEIILNARKIQNLSMSLNPKNTL